MSAKHNSPKSFSPIRFILKVVVSCLAITLILTITLLLLLPPLLSSDFAKGKAALYLAKDLQRSVSIDKLSFSWRKGLVVSDFNIKNKDQTPFFNLSYLELIISWTDMIIGKINIQSLAINGIEATLIRDESGKTNISDILETETKLITLPTLFLDAHLKEGKFTFIDKRLKTTTRIEDLSLDFSVPSLTEPINVFLGANIILNNNPPESIELTGTATLASEGKFNLNNARGTLDMKASFGDLKARVDLAAFNSSEEATGGTLSGSLDLQKLAQFGAGIVGFPPNFSLKGQLKSNLEARGNLQSCVTLSGETHFTGLSIKGGPFKDSPLKQPHVTFSQDILLTFPTETIDIKTVALKSDAITISASGTIKDFQKKPSGKLNLLGTGAIREITLLTGKILSLPSDLKMSGKIKLALSGEGDLNNVSIKGTTKLNDLEISAAFLGGYPFQEKSLTIAPDMQVDISLPMVNITSLRVDSEGFSAAFKGTLDGETNIDLKGHFSSTFSKIKNQLQGVLPAVFPHQGQFSSDLIIKGNANQSLGIKGIHHINHAKISIPSSSDTPSPSPPATLSIPQLNIDHDLTYAAMQDKLTLTSLKVYLPFLNLEGSGELSRLSEDLLTTCQARVTLDMPELQKSLKEVTLDMPELQKSLKDFVPEELSSKGKGVLSVSGEGSLSPPEGTPILSTLRGKGTVSIDSLTYQDVGSVQDLAVTQLSLDNGTLRSTIECLLAMSALQKGPSSPPTPLPKLTITNELVYAAAQDTLSLTSLKADAPFLSLKGSGTLSRLSQDLLTQCQAELTLDMPEVQRLLKDLLPEGLTVQAKGTITFNCKGNLIPPDKTPLLSTWDGDGSLSLGPISYHTIGSIQNLRSTTLSLNKGILDTTLTCLLNNGPTTIEGKMNFRREKPDMKVALNAKEVQLSKDMTILGYFIPILIIPPDGQLSGKGAFSSQANWQGISWDPISKTVNGKGTLNLKDGIIRSKNVVSLILRYYGQPESLQFEQISTGFRLADGKIYNDDIKVDGKELDFNIKGWTSLAYVNSQKGNPMEYSLSGDFSKLSLGKGAEKVLSFFGEEKQTIPIVIAGTVQQPKVSITMPKAGDFLRGILKIIEDKKKPSEKEDKSRRRRR
jgi:hypothetical protein